MEVQVFSRAIPMCRFGSAEDFASSASLQSSIPRALLDQIRSDQYSLQIQITITDAQTTNGGYSDNCGARYSDANKFFLNGANTFIGARLDELGF